VITVPLWGVLNTWLEARPAGGYQLELVSDSKPTGLSGKDIILNFAAAIVATLGLGAITLWFFLGRRRRPQH
jgi:hypothetical protein